MLGRYLPIANRASSSRFHKIKEVDDVIAINFEAVNDDVERSHPRLKVIVLCEPHGCVRTKVIGTDVVRVHVYRAAAPSRRSPQRDDSDEIAARRPGE